MRLTFPPSEIAPLLNNRYTLFILIGSTALILTSGCSTFSGYPQKNGDSQAELRQLQELYYGPDVLLKYEQLAPGSPGRRAFRDRVINGRILAIDDNYQAFVQQFSSFENGSNLAFDAVVLGTSGAAALSPTVGSARVLAAIAAGFTGFRGSVDKNLFYQKTWPALVGQMDALRLAQLVKIRLGLQLPDDQYPLTQGFVDLQGYYMAGTLPGAISGIAVSSGDTSLQANQDLKAIFAKRVQPKAITGNAPRLDPKDTSLRRAIRPYIDGATDEQAAAILSDFEQRQVPQTGAAGVLKTSLLDPTVTGAKLRRLRDSVTKILQPEPPLPQ